MATVLFLKHLLADRGGTTHCLPEDNTNMATVLVLEHLLADRGDSWNYTLFTRGQHQHGRSTSKGASAGGQ